MASTTLPEQFPAAPRISNESAASACFDNHSKFVDPNFDYCRLCAMQCPTTELHDFSASNEDSNRLFATIQQINIDIQQGDHLPQAACNECVRLLKGVAVIIRRITKAQKTLTDIFKGEQLVEVKVEYAENNYSIIEINWEKQQSNEECELNVKKESVSPVTFKDDSEHNAAMFEAESDSNEEEIQNYTEPQQKQGQITTSAITLEHNNLSTAMPIMKTQKEKEQKQKDVHSMLQMLQKEKKQKQKDVHSMLQVLQKEKKQKQKDVHSMLQLHKTTPTTIPDSISTNAPMTSSKERAPIITEDPTFPRWNDSFCCKRCNYKATSLQDLRTHSWSTHKLCLIFKCILCPKPMFDYKRFFGHMRTQHFGALKRCCEFCNEYFISKSVLRTHQQLEHADEAKPHKCKRCGTTFDLPEELQSHRETFLMLGSKEPRKRFKCTECTKDFLNKGTLHRHMLDHDPAKYICPICNKKLKNKMCLRKHVLLIHNADSLRLWICHICGKNFKAECMLKAHVERHDGVLKFSCNICKKKFSSKTHMKMHQVTHSSVRPHVCSVCGQSYKLRGGLKLHMQTHDGVRPHSCDVCNKSFNDWSNYNKHMKRIHLQDMSKRSSYRLRS